MKAHRSCSRGAAEAQTPVALPSQSSELQLLGAVQQEALQVRLADASDRVDVGARAVVFGEITCEAEQDDALLFYMLREPH